MQSESEDLEWGSPSIVVWTELQVPIGLESDQQRWIGYFEPLVHAIGHHETAWARLRVNKDRVILGTWWQGGSPAYRAFQNSPSAQLFRETLADDGITFLTSYETAFRGGHWFDLVPRYFVTIFWVYFKAPVTEAQKREVGNGDGIRPPAILRPRPNELLSPKPPVQLWALHNEYLHGEEVHSLLWPHFWRDEEASLFRHVKFWTGTGETYLETFHRFLRDTGAMEVKEDYCEFKKLVPI
ncbi:hypothetical protein N7539_005558 [Penicillium diatomitis]|uniref:Uncharacterized protein n=1 Tax=Penicillium diatomitis TaxID=2819901 RepID=A0A9W9X737_9EURO|nr:uncharacterized protein N7539_005558 [Penicillium diatomitis]KAJ5485570.1 hypothetical protein N7539_005558 [Penicillium diatomitis]